MLVAVAFALVLAVPAALPDRGAQFRGRTAQGEPISFTVSASPRRLVGLAAQISVSCVGFGAVDERRVFPPIPVHSDGTFSGVSRDVPRRIVPQGDLAWLQGRFVAPRRAKGTVRLLARRYDSRVGFTTCTGVPVAWTAAAT